MEQQSASSSTANESEGAPCTTTPHESSSEGSDPGRLAPKSEVRLGTVGRGRYTFSIVLDNVGGESTTVGLSASTPEIRLYQEECAIAPKSRLPIMGEVDTTGLSLGGHTLGVAVSSPGSSETINVRLRVASVALPAVIGLGYLGVIAQGVIVGSEFLVTLGFSACIIVTLLLWQRARGWQFPALGLGMALIYALVPYGGDLLAHATPGQTPPIPAVSALTANQAQEGIALNWRAPRNWTREWSVCAVRKEGLVPPAHVNDGQLLFIDTRGTGTFTDIGALERGQVYTYAIFVCDLGKSRQSSAGVSASAVLGLPSDGKARPRLGSEGALVSADRRR